MTDSATLARIEALVDDSKLAETIEPRLPTGVRPRQLSVRTLFVGMLIALSDGRPAHLTRVWRALTYLAKDDQLRLGVVIDRNGQPHLLTYRQVEYTYGLVVRALSKEALDGEPTQGLSAVVDSLIEASIPETYKNVSKSLAIDWTDVETFANPVGKAELESRADPPADPEASWGHRRGDGPGQRDELFFGYYCSLATMVKEEKGVEVPELVRRMSLTTCKVDPVPAFIPVLKRLVALGVHLGDVVADSGYAHRVAQHWAIPLRALGAGIVTDLHPNDRGRQGTHQGATIFNGNLYCPATPESLFDIGPLSRAATKAETDQHDAKAEELSRYKLSKVASEDEDGYWRAGCPAGAGKVRCPLKAPSMELAYGRPEILEPPGSTPVCCSQATITVPPSIGAKTRQKHDYPSKAHRVSYARRTAVERSNSRIKDPATVDISKGWCRLFGLVPLTLFLAAAIAVRNVAVADAFEERQAEDARRQAAGLPIRKRKRRRRTLTDLAGANAPPSANSPPAAAS